MLAHPGAAVYGTVTIGALLAAESAKQETYAETLAAVVTALLLYWLAHSYAELTARRLESAEPLTFAVLARTMRNNLLILAGAAIPLLTLLTFWAAGAQLTTAVNAAIWAAASVIVLVEAGLGLRARLSGTQLLIQTALGTLLGLLVIVLKVLLH